MVGSRYVIFFCLLFPFALQAQTDRYIIYLKDKNGTPFSVSKPEEFLTAKSIQRRVKQKIDVVEEDLPLSPNYVTQLRNTGASVYFSSKWMNCVLVQGTSAQALTIQSLPFVSKAELVAPGKKLTSGRSKRIKRRKDVSSAPATNAQLMMMGIDSMHLDGFKGEGISVALFDSGFEGVDIALPFKPVFQEGRFNYSFDFIANSKNVFQYDDHGTEVFSVMAAYLQGTYTGGAYKATYNLFVTEDVGSEYRIEEYNWLFAAEKADSLGVDVINASLGYNLFDDASMDYKTSDLNGSTALVSRAAGKALAKGMIVVCSAGNEGSNSWKLVTPPADVDGVLAIGAVTTSKTRSSFSSVGPTTDGRIKPDVVALGSGTSVIDPGGAVGAVSGTSLSAPLVTSLAAGLWQRYPALTSGEIYQAIITSADQFLNPDNLKGYGIPNYNTVKKYLDSLRIDDDLVIYPNPTNDSIRVAFKRPQDKPVIISTFNPQGKLLSEYSVNITLQNNPLVIDLTPLSAGLYFVRVTLKDTIRTIRVVKL